MNKQPSNPLGNWKRDRGGRDREAPARQRKPANGSFSMREDDAGGASALAMDARTLAGLQRFIRRSAAAGPSKDPKTGGRGGDTELVHVNAGERQVLESLGGAGSRNPGTGLREYKPYGSIGGGSAKGAERQMKSGSQKVSSGGSWGDKGVGGGQGNKGGSGKDSLAGLVKAGATTTGGEPAPRSIGDMLRALPGKMMPGGELLPTGRTAGAAIKGAVPPHIALGMAFGELMMHANEAVIAENPEAAFSIDGKPAGAYVDGKVYSNANLASHQVNMVSLMNALERGMKDVSMADIVGRGVGGGENKGAAGEAGPGVPPRHNPGVGALKPPGAPVDPTDETLDMIFKPYQGDLLHYGEQPAGEHNFFPNGAVPGVFG